MVCIAHDSNYPFTVGVKLMDSAGFSQESFSGRSVRRVQVVMSCRLSWPGVEVVALTRDLSPTGLALSLSDASALTMKEQARIHLQNRITLQAIPVHTRHEPGKLVAGFKVATIE